MQELEFVPDDSDAASLVLRTVGASGEEELFRLPVTDALRSRLSGDGTAADTDAAADRDAATGEAEATEPPSDAPAPRLSVTSVERPAEPRKEKVRLRPREIQKRLRHGATVAELAAETGASETRLLPYAHPIAMERHRIAELARQAYPVRADGPADHTLWEVLATAFGARGEDVRAATWDAAMDSSDTWIVSVTWTRGNRQGATEFVAEFRWIPASSPGLGPSTVEPANSVAGDLIDPRFNRPVRSVSPATAPVEPELEDADATGDGYEAEVVGTDNSDGSDSSADGAPGIAPAVDLFGDPTPDNRSHPSKRRRSAATPHWEDVLLGVQTSPRRKK